MIRARSMVRWLLIALMMVFVGASLALLAGRIDTAEKHSSAADARAARAEAASVALSDQVKRLCRNKDCAPVVTVPSTGPAGATGLTGPQGPAGRDGTDGTDGDPGPRGAMGRPGVDGSDGATGATGATGPQGPAGPAGADGTNGTDGKDGVDGKDGQSAFPFTFVWTYETFPNHTVRATCTITSPSAYECSTEDVA